MALDYDAETEEPVIADDDEYTFLDEFEEEYDIAGLDMMDLFFATGRTWESEETEDGGFTVRTTSNPTMRVYDTEEGAYVLLYIKGPDIVTTAIRVTGNLTSFLFKLVASIEADFDGIKHANVESVTDTFETTTERLAEVANSYGE